MSTATRKKVLRFVFDTVLILAAAAFLSALLFNAAPGADVDQREMNSGYSEKTLEEIRAERRKIHSFSGRSVGFFLAILRGDLGVSEINQIPVRDMVRERAPLTARMVLVGSTAGFLAGTILGALAYLLFPRALQTPSVILCLTLLSLPAGLLVLLAVFGRFPIEAAVAAVVTPRVYFYAGRLFSEQESMPYVLAAIGAGIHPLRLLTFHILPAMRAELAGLAGFAAVTAIAATIPAEALSNQPGLGQMAMNSAMERDLPVVIAITLITVLASRTITLVSSLPSTATGNK